MLEWRKFNFFDLKPYGDEEIVLNLIGEADVVSTTCGNNQIILGDSNGFIHVCPKNFRESYSFKAHENSVSFCELSNQNNLLITLGVDDSVEGIPEFRVWNLSKLNKSIPALLWSMKTNIQKPTALAVSENGLFMAIGFERGNVSLYKGDVAREKSKIVKNLTFGTSSIRGCSFKQVGKTIQMFVCSDSGVYLYTIQNRDKEFKSNLDTVNATSPTTSFCLQTGHNEGYFMVGRDDAIYCYTNDGRAPCYAFDGRKVFIRWFRSHLLIVTSPLHDTSSSKPYTLTVIDVVNRFIVFTTQVEPIASVFIVFGTCYVLTKGKLLYHLDEKDLQSKLSSLYKKTMFDTAVKIAKNNQYDAEGLSEIFKQYGDHLYSKGNFAGAVEQYIKTIGFLEPSYVIRRFLDSRHTQYLTDYLESVHKESKATADHTTLLLNCFTRLDRISDLKSFLENYKQNNFDIDVAIRVCRKSCIDQALELAKFNNKHDHAVGILIEDMKLYIDAVNYIGKLSYDDSERNLMKYGNILMEHCAKEVVDLLKKLCTDFIAKKCNEPEKEVETDLDIFNHGYRNGGFDDKEQGTPEDFIHLFTDSKQLIEYIEYLIRNLPITSNFLYNSLIEHYLTLWKLSDNTSNERMGFEQRLVELIKNDEHYDDNHVLVLCQTYEFWLGAMLIYEEKKLYHLIVRHYLATKDYFNLHVLCKRLGTTEPTIWVHTLNSLKMNNQVPTTFLQEILQVIGSIQSPLQVLNVLTSIENGPNLSSVRHYFTQIFQKEGDAMNLDEIQAEKCRSESETLKQHINTLNKNPQEFRGASLCDACHQPLHLPALYFLCQHSFHQDCIRSYSETEKDCMVCRKKNDKLVDVIYNQNETRNKVHVFNNELISSQQPFSVVASYFGRGLFNTIVVVSDDDDDLKENTDDLNATKKTMQRPQEQPIPIISEAKIRLEEHLRTNIEHKPQLSEGRLRFQEQGYGTKIKENQQKITAPSRSIPLQLQSRKIEPKSAAPINYPKNPFDDEDYDQSKNPFADDSEEACEATEKKQSTNPFEDET